MFRWVKLLVQGNVCWACSSNRCGSIFDNTCTCCRNNHR